MRPLSLHHMVALDASPIDLVRIAAGLDCAHVCLFTRGADDRFPTIDEAAVAPLRAVMDECGVTAHCVASFPLTPGLDLSTYAAALERGARLGATRASANLPDPDEARAADAFARFHALAASFGLEGGFEYRGYRDADAFDRAVRIATAAGISGAIAIDPLHIMRSGTPIAALQAADPAMFGYFQLCDGPLAATAEDYKHESMYDRLAPGEGEFPLAEIAALLPPDRTASLEIPMESLRLKGVSPADRARKAVAGARALFAVD